MENSDLKLYRVLPAYSETLRNKSIGGDPSLYITKDEKIDRPFIGIITICNNRKYCIPLTSSVNRLKYLTAKEPDFTPIYKNGKMIAGIEFNKMIPVIDNQIRELDIVIRGRDRKYHKEYIKEKRKYEYDWCNKHKQQIESKASALYDLYVSGNTNYKNRKNCANFPELERICDEYAKSHPQQHKAHK